jgi:hypothetical protein
MTGNPYGPGRNIPGTADWNAAQTWNKPKSPPPPSPSPFSSPAPSPSWSSPTTYPSHEVRGSSSIGQGSSDRKGSSAGVKLLSFLFAIGILFVSAIAKIPLGTMFVLLIVLGITGCLIWFMRKALLAAAFIGFVLFCIYLLAHAK